MFGDGLCRVSLWSCCARPQRGKVARLDENKDRTGADRFGDVHKPVKAVLHRVAERLR